MFISLIKNTSFIQQCFLKILIIAIILVITILTAYTGDFSLFEKENNDIYEIDFSTPSEVMRSSNITQNKVNSNFYKNLSSWTKIITGDDKKNILLSMSKYSDYAISKQSVDYNRQAAYDYANYYWDEVCNDGYYMALDVNGATKAVWFSLGTSYTDIQYFFDHNTTYGQLYGADCAHFVSSCIGENGGGGLPVPHDYSPIVYGYVSATGLADWILNNNYGLQKYSISDLEMGDVILYDVSGGGHHTVLYLGDGLIAAHSICLWGKTSIPLYGKSWIQPGLTVNKLIHITPSNPPIITITSPTNGTVWNVGETRNITWTVSGDTSNIDYFLLGYSIDGGNNYNLVNGVNSTAPGTARTYSWAIPNTPSTQCKILIGAIDANGNSLTAVASDGFFEIAQAIDPLSITTFSLPSGTQNQFYSASFSATGGTTPYMWSKSSGTFPSGLSLSSSGVLSGIPTNYGNFNFTIQVMDSGGRTDSKSFTLYINQAIATRIIRLEGDLNFGNVQVGDSPQRTLTIYNDGNSTLTVSSISYPSSFSSNWSGDIFAGGSENVTVTFSPTQPIIYSGTLTVNSDKTSGDNTKSVSGTGVPSTYSPQVTTKNASNITSISAQLNGNLDSTGNLSCQVWFEYGKTTSYGSLTTKQSKSSVGPFNDTTIISLDPKTTYHFKAYASNSEETVYGADKIFITPMLGDFGSANNGPPDCIVDFEDLMIFALAYGSTPADANWNPVCDIARPGDPIPDGVIDFEDLMVFAIHYGETCADL